MGWFFTKKTAEVEIHDPSVISPTRDDILKTMLKKHKYHMTIHDHVKYDFQKVSRASAKHSVEYAHIDKDFIIFSNNNDALEAMYKDVHQNCKI